VTLEDEPGEDQMNEILKIAGAPVKIRLHSTDSWKVTMREEGKHIVFSTSRQSRGNPWALDPHPVRDAFMKIASPEDALALLQEFGPFQRVDPRLPFGSKETARDVQFAVLMKFQKLWREYITMLTPEFVERVSAERELTRDGFFEALMFRGHPLPHATPRLGYVKVHGEKIPAPYLDIVSGDVETAIFDSIYIDKVAGLRGGVCKKCGNTFLVPSDKREFCKTTCADAYRQAAYRQAKRMTLSKPARAKPQRKS